VEVKQKYAKIEGVKRSPKVGVSIAFVGVDCTYGNRITENIFFTKIKKGSHL